MESVKIAVIGGSGLYNMPAISDVATLELETPFGKPSGALRIGTLRGRRVAFLPRHGEGHILSPATLPYRANILALKQLGVRFIIAVNAVGSLREELAPGHVVTPDQIVDYTIQQARAFFLRKRRGRAYLSCRTHERLLARDISGRGRGSRRYYTPCRHNPCRGRASLRHACRKPSFSRLGLRSYRNDQCARSLLGARSGNRIRFSGAHHRL